MRHGRVTETRSPAPVAEIRRSVESPAVTFVTVTYGTGPIIVDALASLVRSLSDSDVTYEVIVVDNRHPAVPGRTLAEVRLFTSGVTVVESPTNLGFGGGCELGALHARGRVLAFVNPDVTFSPGWLEPLLAALRQPTESGRCPSIIGPTLLEPDGSVQEIGQRLFSTGATSPNSRRGNDDSVVRVDYSSAACWLIDRAEHERLGGFDPAYHPAYFEDVDLALRADLLGGGAAVHRGVTVVHHRGSGTPDRPISADAQRAELLARWPGVRWRQPAPSV